MTKMTPRQVRQYKKKQKIRRRNLLIFCVLVIFFIFLIDKINLSRGILKINRKDVAYVEFIKFQEGNMKTVKDPGEVRKILRNLKLIRGKEIEEDRENDLGVTFINIYDTTNKKWELAKSGIYLKINGKTYDIGQSGSSQFDKTFEKFSK